MKNSIMRVVMTLALVGMAFTVLAKSVDQIEEYGVYVVAEKGYVKVGAYNHIDRFVDFKHLNEIEYVKRADQTLKLIVYEKNFSKSSISLETRPLDTVVDVSNVPFDIKPLSKIDMYELTFNKSVADGVMLHVHSSDFFNDNFGVIMLGETQAQLVKYFSQKNLPNAVFVRQYLDDARVAFPNNAELKVLAKYWEKAANDAKDLKDYSYVDEKWTAYQQGEKLTLKARYLRELIGEINGYLNDHPNGYKVDEAKQRRAHAEEKLKEYEKLL